MLWHALAAVLIDKWRVNKLNKHMCMCVYVVVVMAGSEYESDENMDLDEKDDILEQEAGDADDVGPEEDLRNQVHRVHMWVGHFLNLNM